VRVLDDIERADNVEQPFSGMSSSLPSKMRDRISGAAATVALDENSTP
jgi:hypothetical protein